MKMTLYKLANLLYKHCYPVYRPLYTSWKALSDRRERDLFRQLAKRDMTIVDVGANIGIYTRFLAKLTGERGHVYAFEPSPDNFTRLCDNVSEFNNLTTVQTAIGDLTGEAALYISEDLNVDHRAYDSGDGRRKIVVPVIRLDDYFTPGQRIDLMKIDVQGYEYNVLNGARRILKENSEIAIIMEFWPYGLRKAGIDPGKLLDLISSMGFTARKTIDPSGSSFDGRHLDLSREDDYCNLLISRHPAVRLFKMP